MSPSSSTWSGPLLASSGGALANWHPTDLLGFALTALLERTGVDPETNRRCHRRAA